MIGAGFFNFVYVLFASCLCRGAETPSQWQTFLHSLDKTQVDNQHLSALLSPLIGHYQFNISETQLRRGLVYSGSNHRLRGVVKKGMEGKLIKIGVIGGSITNGHGASVFGKTDWPSVFGKWASTSFGSVKLRNGAIPGTPSAYMTVCLDMSVDQDVDVVLSEYVLNDGRDNDISRGEKSRAYERLVRRVLDLPNKPALILMQVFSHGNSFPSDHHEWQPFHNGLEELYGSLAQYYDLPWLSLRDATYRPAIFNHDPHLSLDKIMIAPLDIHTSDLGHKILADLAVWLFMQTALDLLLQPFGEEDKELIEEGSPSPMFPGNTVPSSPMCWHYDALKDIIIKADGFEAMVEGKNKKPGYVGLKPGSTISFLLNTCREGCEGGKESPTGPSAPHVLVQIGHLKSYQHMGIAVVNCTSGCTCEGKEIDGHHDILESQTHLSSVDVTQSKNCVLQVTVTDRTHSNETKVKIISLIVSDMAGPTGNAHQFQREGNFGLIDFHFHD